MDILDMPNTNKYSFEGWDSSLLLHLFVTHYLEGIYTEHDLSYH